MRQVVQDLRSGKLEIEDVPAPMLLGTTLLVVNEYSLISAGTERATVELARKSLVAKAHARPDLVRKVVQAVQRDGIVETARMVNARLDRSSRLGYSCAGTVAAVGSGVRGFAVGDRVACAGQDHASHAEVVCVPANLCVHIPPSVSSEDAAYVALGAIALQAVRQTAPNIGEIVAVIGLGLVGQLVAQLLSANGCRVIASDLDASKLSLAEELGIHRAVLPDALIAACAQETLGRGVDAVVLTASTASNEPIEVAAELSRQKGRVVVVGAVGLHVPREPYYRKELELRLSTSYGPGRYDAAYEEGGIDYPFGFVRWTQGRNLDAFLGLLQDRRVNVSRLTSHRFDIADAQAAYEVLHSGERCLGILLEYPRQPTTPPLSERVRLRPQVVATGQVRIALIGPGNHLQDKLLPHLRARRDVALHAVCAGNGVNAKRVAQAVGAEYCTTDYREVLNDSAVDAVVIATRHDNHARIVCDALRAGKHVFVEKPLCLTEAELTEVEQAYAAASANHNRILLVGFNRRHSPHVKRITEFFAERTQPLLLSYRVNAGPLAGDHWMNAQGGRLLGEACHFIDTISALAAPATQLNATATDDGNQLIITLDLADGSIATILYSGAGDPELPKERLEVFGGGKVAVLDDFSQTTFHANGRRRRFQTRPRDKGFANEMAFFIDAIARGICGDAVFAAARLSTLATLRAHWSLATLEPKTMA